MSFWERSSKEDRDFFTRAIYETSLTSGFPGLQDMTEEDGLKFMSYFIARHPELILERFRFTTSYTDDLLEQARDFVRAERWEFAIMFYATWIEHSLNSLFADAFRSTGHSEEETDDFIRANSIWKKTSSAWSSVFGDSVRLSDELVSNIRQVATNRNAFAHYKWRSSLLTDEIELHEQSNALVSAAELCVTELGEVGARHAAHRRSRNRG